VCVCMSMSDPQSNILLSTSQLFEVIAHVQVISRPVEVRVTVFGLISRGICRREKKVE
jgi:hypothetical protein